MTSKKRRKVGREKGNAASSLMRGGVVHTDTHASANLEQTTHVAAHHGFHSDAESEKLLAACRTQWQYGEWSDLASVDLVLLETHRDRARLALLVAAAKSHLGRMDEAKALLQRSLAWGCDRRLVARVMTSMAYNTLGRWAAGLEKSDAATAHFKTALGLVDPSSASALPARTRQIRETARMGLLPEAASQIETDHAVARQDPTLSGRRLELMEDEIRVLKQALFRARSASLSSSASDEAPSLPPAMEGGEVRAFDDKLFSNSRFSKRAYNHYADMCRRDAQGGLRYLDVKSLPRSGLHYLKNSLEAALGQLFSFCEWYQEPGCCRQMPCALTGFCKSQGGSRDTVHVRMVKSHDFDLGDPPFLPFSGMRRIILIRDPLYILTSWWTLEVIQRNADLLADHGLKVTKLYYSHERSVLSSAHEIIEEYGSLPSVGSFHDWMGLKKNYILDFVKKWAHEAENVGSGHEVVCYQDVPSLVRRVLLELSLELHAEDASRVNLFVQGVGSSFKERGSPFTAPVPRVSAFLLDNANSIRSVADEIFAEDSSKVLQRCRVE